jgi:hypothetical protein
VVVVEEAEEKMVGVAGEEEEGEYGVAGEDCGMAEVVVVGGGEEEEEDITFNTKIINIP